jgi:hypothetical protein
MNLSPGKSPNSPTDFDPSLENDAVWNLLEEASPVEASPRFTDDTLRRIRLESEIPTPWWKSLLSPKPVIATLVTAAAAVVIVVSLPDQSPEVAEPVAKAAGPIPAEDWENLEDNLAHELLSGVAEDPSLLSDEEIVALLY